MMNDDTRQMLGPDDDTTWWMLGPDDDASIDYYWTSTNNIVLITIEPALTT